ncbi:MAG: dihydropteroate synthase, partial [Planctomycetaceae bacterium]|nr:dihydropteroate synthase [Planctomycetaceae bacterium]
MSNTSRLVWQLRTRCILLDQPIFMGIVNVTPDSFSDGGQFYRNGRLDVSAAVDYAMKLAVDGADILDIGA